MRKSLFCSIVGILASKNRFVIGVEGSAPSDIRMAAFNGVLILLSVDLGACPYIKSA